MHSATRMDSEIIRSSSQLHGSATICKALRFGLIANRWSISVVKPALAFRAAMRFMLWSSPFGIPTYVVLQIILACNLVKPPAFCRCILCLAISLGRCTARHVMC
ncbi:unnamed protein product [Lathyrus oleraceus]